ncbi:MAG: hypothetical protein NT027_16405 [Proteobacteria bacterium]|jgi:hypothetical protein|nr:hypothetical protein [Pseudomonadota bacterium]
MSRADVVAKKSSNVKENYFDTYPPLPLPAIWRVIYHEAIRGNHILWETADLQEIERNAQNRELNLSKEDTISITRFMAKFFSNGDYRELKQMIQTLPQAQKSLVFVLYGRAIKVWQKWLKTNLH